MTLCYDCHSAPATDTTDCCAACQELADEVDYEERYCRSEHGTDCGCWLSSYAALAYELAKASPLVEAVQAHCAVTL